MKITKLSCTACGAPISIPADLDQITCTACGTGLIIERGEGYVALKLAEKIARSIEISGIQTQDAIHENTSVTRQELQRLQMSQEVSSLQMQLNGIQTEIRLLRRDPENKKAKKQLCVLESKEFQMMEQIHSLKKQAFSPNPNNLRASISFYDWEYGWVDAEIAVLNEGNLSQKYDLITRLQKQKGNILNSLDALKTAELKKIFPSFTIPDPTTDNADQILKVLAMVDNDERGCRQYLGLSEGREVHRQLVQRQYNLRHRADQLELAQVQRNLGSLNMQPNPSDAASLVAYLNQLDTDIQTLDRASGSNAIKDLRKQLNKSRYAAIKQLNSLNKANSRSTMADTTPGIFAGMSLFFAGIDSWFANITKTSASNGQWEKHSQPNWVGTNRVGSDSKSVAHPTFGGFLVWFFTLVLSFLIGSGLLSMTNKNAIATGFPVSLFVASVTIGFILGARAFLKRASASIRVEGLGKMKDVCILTRNPGKGINNLNAIKFWVGLIVLISVLLIGFIAVPLAENFPTLMLLIFFTSIVMAIAFAIVAAKRTSFLSPADTE